MELTRKQVIETISNMDKAYRNFTGDEIEALEYAIKTLKTDEAYQLMYEGVEVYDKDTVLWMFRELQLEILELKSYESADGQDLVMLADIGTLFQQKINNLGKDGK